MTALQDRVRLVVGGIQFGGWKNVRIETGIDRQARSFDLEVTDRWPGSTDVPRRVKPGDACALYIGEDRVATGYIDGTPIRYDATSVTVGIRARSKTADLVDCCPEQGSKGGGSTAPASGNVWAKLGIQSIDGKGTAAAPSKPVKANAKGGAGGQWRGVKLEQIAADMASPYGVTVLAEVDTGAALAHQVQQGETVFESIDRMLRLRHCLASDNAMGDLVFIVAGSGGRASTVLELGRNIRAGDTQLDFKGVYSEYVCKGQKSITSQQTDEDESGEDVDTAVTSSISSSATVTDSRVGRRRLLVLKQSGQVDDGTCADRVRFERAHRAAKALETVYTVDGWRQADGALWVQNQIVRVIDPVIGFDTEMLIAQVVHLLDEQGQRTELKVGPLDGYVSAAQKKQKPAKGSKIVKNRYAPGNAGLGIVPND